MRKADASFLKIEQRQQECNPLDQDQIGYVVRVSVKPSSPELVEHGQSAVQLMKFDDFLLVLE